MGCEFLFLAILGLSLKLPIGCIFGPKNVIRVSFNKKLLEIINIILKVYGPSKKNYYEAGADLGLWKFV